MTRLVIATMVLLSPVWSGLAVSAKTATNVSTQDVQRETKEALETTREYTVQQKADFEKTMRKKLHRMEKQIDHLKFKANRAKKETKAEIDQAIGDVEVKWKEAGKKLQELQAASGQAWNDLRSGFNSAMADLENAFKQARARVP